MQYHASNSMYRSCKSIPILICLHVRNGGVTQDVWTNLAITRFHLARAGFWVPRWPRCHETMPGFPTTQVVSRSTSSSMGSTGVERVNPELETRGPLGSSGMLPCSVWFLDVSGRLLPSCLASAAMLSRPFSCTWSAKTQQNALAKQCSVSET